jgi:hypothetical protein
MIVPERDSRAGVVTRGPVRQAARMLEGSRERLGKRRLNVAVLETVFVKDGESFGRSSRRCSGLSSLARVRIAG